MWQSFGVRDHDRGSRVVVISNHEYSEKFNAQIHRRSITQLVHDITQSSESKVNSLTILNLIIVNLKHCIG